MKKIIPFRKEIIFKTNIGEITSISLEHDLSIDEVNISGEFIISGDYKISDNSKTVEPFEYNIPFEIVLDEKYDTSKSVVDIDDFYYEIIDDKALAISIDLVVDKLSEILIEDDIPNLEEKKDIIEELFEEQNDCRNNSYVSDDKIIVNDNTIVNSERCVEENDVLPGKEEIDNVEEKMQEEVKENKENKENIENINDKINSIFSNVGEGDMYVSYNVYILREGDTIESVIDKYQTNEEELKKYNNLNDLKLSDKLIIPANK